MSADTQYAQAGFEPTRQGNSWIGRRFAIAALRGGSLLAFAIILITFSLTSPFFLSFGNIGNVLGQSAIAGVLSIGLTIVLIAGGSNVVTGGIDLSLAANMGLSAAIYASLVQLGFGDATAIAAAIATGALIGLVNAAAIILAGIVPLLASLAVMNIVGGLELVLTQNTVIPVSTPFPSCPAATRSAFPFLPMCCLASRCWRRQSCNTLRQDCAFMPSVNSQRRLGQAVCR